MCLIPTTVLAATLAVAWRWEWVGAVVFLGLAYAALAGLSSDPMVFSAVVGPLMMLGALFVAAWLWARRARAA